MRYKVEIWVDGGIWSVNDVLKIMFFGVNCIGFGILLMIVIGCIICCGCYLDICYVGIVI